MMVENIHKLTQQQLDVLIKLKRPMRSEKEWFYTIRQIYLASGGLLSSRVVKAIKLMTQFKLYEDEYYVRHLQQMLLEEFPASVRLYVAKGLIAQTQERPLTTLQAPRSLDEALQEASEKEDEAEEWPEFPSDW